MHSFNIIVQTPEKERRGKQGKIGEKGTLAHGPHLPLLYLCRCLCLVSLIEFRSDSDSDSESDLQFPSHSIPPPFSLCIMSVGGIARRVTRLQHANVVRHPVAWSLSSSSSSSSLSFLPSSRSFTSTRSFATTPNADTVYDVAIIGCGAHGTSTAYHLAKKGKKVTRTDRQQ